MTTTAVPFNAERVEQLARRILRDGLHGCHRSYACAKPVANVLIGLSMLTELVSHDELAKTIYEAMEDATERRDRLQQEEEEREEDEDA